MIDPHQQSGERLRDRAHGCVLGLALGEALGRPLESLTHQQARQELTNAPRLATGRGDQAAMAMLLAESLLQRGRLDPGDLSARLREWMRGGARDVGHVAARALYLQGQGQPWADSARAAWEEQATRAATAEALVRGAPLALRPDVDEETLARASLAASAVTHFDPRCRWAAAALNLMLARLLRGAGQGLPGSILGLVQERHVFRALEAIPTLMEGQLEARNDALLTLQAAAWCALNSNDFRAAVLTAVSLGGASPLVGAACGALVGARWGANQIPAEWLAALPDAPELIRLADSLIQQRPPELPGLAPERRNGPTRTA